MEKNQPTNLTIQKTDHTKNLNSKNIVVTDVSEPLLLEKETDEEDFTLDGIGAEVIETNAESESLTKNKFELVEDIPDKSDANTDYRPKLFHTVCLCGTRFVLVSFFY